MERLRFKKVNVFLFGGDEVGRYEMALKCSFIVEYSRGINFFPAFFGLVEVFVPEQRIRAVAVFAWTDGGSGSEKTVGRIPFDIRSVTLGMDSRIPLMGIVAGWT